MGETGRGTREERTQERELREHPAAQSGLAPAGIFADLDPILRKSANLPWRMEGEEAPIIFRCNASTAEYHCPSINRFQSHI